MFITCQMNWIESLAGQGDMEGDKHKIEVREQTGVSQDQTLLNDSVN